MYLTFTQEADEPPDEVAAVVAEGGFGQGDSPEAVARCGALVLGPETGGLLRPLLPGQGARCPAVRRVRLRRFNPAGVRHVLQHTTTRGVTGFTGGAEKPGALENTPPPAARHPPGTARGKGAVFGVSPGAPPPPLLQKLIIQVQKYRVGNQVTTL